MNQNKKIVNHFRLRLSGKPIWEPPAGQPYIMITVRKSCFSDKIFALVEDIAIFLFSCDRSLR